MKLLPIALALCAAPAFAQMVAANPLVNSSRTVYEISKNDILRSVDKLPENLWAFQPTKEVRTVAQLFAHIADAQYEFCGAVTGGHSVSKNIEKTVTTKVTIVPALKEAFAYCDAAYASLSDTTAVTLADFFGMKLTKITVLDFSTAHNMEHYGNLVTYMRINHIVPPSSEPRTPAAPKKEPAPPKKK